MFLPLDLAYEAYSNGRERLSALTGIFVFTTKRNLGRLANESLGLSALTGIFVFTTRYDNWKTSYLFSSLSALTGIFVFTTLYGYYVWRVNNATTGSQCPDGHFCFYHEYYLVPDRGKRLLISVP